MVTDVNTKILITNYSKADSCPCNPEVGQGLEVIDKFSEYFNVFRSSATAATDNINTGL